MGVRKFDRLAPHFRTHDLISRAARRLQLNLQSRDLSPDDRADDPRFVA